MSELSAQQSQGNGDVNLAVETRTKTMSRGISRLDYRPSPFLVPETELSLELDCERTIVRSKLHIIRNPAISDTGEPLILDGENLRLKSIKINGRNLEPTEYVVTDQSLEIRTSLSDFCLDIEVEIVPSDNKSGKGLYVSGEMLTTQMEADGMRRLTYCLDRTDVLSAYTITLTANRDKYPVLLSNGNQSDLVELGDGRHSQTFRDPFPKPTYLVAIVAGVLECTERQFITLSGREVALRAYVDPGNSHLVEHALNSLERAMKWDEEAFRREYDLDVFNMVATRFFNMGGMENKGLNIFNAQSVLVDPKTATDAEYQRAEQLVAHEYFHNWTGNRVTCRSWHDLCLKEGLTVFRDELFTSDVRDSTIRTIEICRFLREVQFLEDGGKLAHPVRPEHYQAVDNLYSATVYRKGAAIFRMVEAFVGRNGFRKGTDLYFERHDGQAVTTEDFIAAIDDATGENFGDQFFDWFTKPGTPILDVESEYDPESKECLVKVKQSRRCGVSTADDSAPFRIPLRMALLSTEGKELPLHVSDGVVIHRVSPTDVIFDLTKSETTLRFSGVSIRPILSLNRNFTAPIIVNCTRQHGDVFTLATSDPNLFSRYDAIQTLIKESILAHLADKENASTLGIFIELRRLIGREEFHPAFIAEALTPPSVEALAQECDKVDYSRLHTSREVFKARLGMYRADIREVYERLSNATSRSVGNDPWSVGERRLKNVCLDYLLASGYPRAAKFAAEQAEKGLMNDRLAALAGLCATTFPERDAALLAFNTEWRSHPLMMNKWLAIQAEYLADDDVLTRIKNLSSYVSVKDPNSVRALYGGFSRNYRAFHAHDGSGYDFMADKVIEVDEANPQVAGMLVKSFNSYPKLEDAQRAIMKRALQRIVDSGGLSNTVGSNVMLLLEA